MSDANERYKVICQELNQALDNFEPRWKERKMHPTEWVAYINHVSTRWIDGTTAPYSSFTVDQYRAHMIKTAAWAISAALDVDEQREKDDRFVYEDIDTE